ncbi:unnamed protein product [Microthlaspi erraticum]|uniref:Uncharacterized protein n=1 Tax=Microthlaspi erraticum TaxID=1685480 RepID=A0A6D2KMJ2_9BRAS|nr:unnamed protein product [Microthlaspi erraticum]
MNVSGQSRAEFGLGKCIKPESGAVLLLLTGSSSPEHQIDISEPGLRRFSPLDTVTKAISSAWEWLLALRKEQSANRGSYQSSICDGTSRTRVTTLSLLANMWNPLFFLRSWQPSLTIRKGRGIVNLYLQSDPSYNMFADAIAKSSVFEFTYSAPSV